MNQQTDMVRVTEVVGAQVVSSARRPEWKGRYANVQEGEDTMIVIVGIEVLTMIRIIERLLAVMSHQELRLRQEAAM